MSLANSLFLPIQKERVAREIHTDFDYVRHCVDLIHQKITRSIKPAMFRLKPTDCPAALDYYRRHITELFDTDDQSIQSHSLPQDLH